jgi:predicted TIM-barrel fold metal-dependent hydrolase
LKREIPRRLSERVMFAADYPLFSYDRLFADWRGLGYSEELLQRIFHDNAQALLAKLGR